MKADDFLNANRMKPMPDRPWINRAECRGMDPNIFFPERGDQSAAKIAKAICDVCRAKDDCLEENIRKKEGIYGGTSNRERREILRERASKATKR